MSHEKGAGKRAINGVEVVLKPLAPYDFSLSTRIFPPHNSPVSGKSCYREVLRLKGIPALVTVTDEGTIENPVLRMQVRGKESLSDDQIEDAETAVYSILNLSLDLLLFYRHVRGDPVLGPVTKRLRGLKPRKTPTVFEVLVRSIIEQQISLTAAYRIQERVIHSFGETLSLEEGSFSVFPTPGQLAHATEEGLRACGLSRNKASYIVGIAHSIAEGSCNLERMAEEQNMNTLLAALKEIRGVGRWTAEMVMLRGMGKYEAFPADDLGLRRTLAEFYRNGAAMNAEEARKLADPWGPWKGLAAFYLISAEWEGENTSAIPVITDP